MYPSWKAINSKYSTSKYCNNLLHLWCEGRVGGGSNVNLPFFLLKGHCGSRKCNKLQGGLHYRRMVEEIKGYVEKVLIVYWICHVGIEKGRRVKAWKGIQGNGRVQVTLYFVLFIFLCKSKWWPEPYNSRKKEKSVKRLCTEVYILIKF